MARLLPRVLIRLRKLSCEAAKVLIRTVVPHDDDDDYTAVYPTLGLVTHLHEINIIRLSRLFPSPYMLLVLSSFVRPSRILWAQCPAFQSLHGILSALILYVCYVKSTLLLILNSRSIRLTS
jgi:hypothetical protein